MSVLSLRLKWMRNSGLSKKKEKFLCAKINDVGKKRCTILPCLFYRLVLALPCQHTLGQSYSGSAEPAGLKLRCVPDFPSSLPPLPTARAQILRSEPTCPLTFKPGSFFPDLSLWQDISRFSYGTAMNSATHVSQLCTESSQTH